MNDVQTYADLAAARSALREQISTDPAVLAAALDPTWRQRDHLRVVGQAYRALETGRINRLLISLPPQVGKSSCAAQWGAFWWLLKRPTDRVMLVSYGSSLAESHAFATRGHIAEHGAEFGMNLHPKSAARADWRLTSGGGMLASGILGGVTGRSADLLIVDDPHKNRQEADSLRAREAIHTAWHADLISRLAPDAPAVIITTRWHEDDLAARVLKEDGQIRTGGRWLYLRMPALCDDPANDPLRRPIGAPLPHPKISDHDTERLMRHWMSRKASRPREWAALYMADPVPMEGALVSWELLRAMRVVDPDVRSVRTVVAIDPSGGGQDEAGIIAGFRGEDRRLYITHDRSKPGPCSTGTWARAACALAYEIDADAFVVERNFGGDQCSWAVRSAWALMQRDGDIPVTAICPRVAEVNARAGKRLRAEPVAGQMEQDRVKLVGLFPELETQWATWQPDSSESPGRLDACVYLAFELIRPPGMDGLVSQDPNAGSRTAIGLATSGSGPRIHRG